MLLKSHVGVWYCFAQKGNLALVSKPISLALEILNAELGLAVEPRADLWFLDMGCGSGNVTIAARLFGLNVIAIDKSAYAVDLAKNRVFNSHEQCWTCVFTETMLATDRKAARTVVEAYVQCAPPILTLPAPPPSGGDSQMTEVSMFPPAPDEQDEQAQQAQAGRRRLRLSRSRLRMSRSRRTMRIRALHTNPISAGKQARQPRS